MSRNSTTWRKIERNELIQILTDREQLEIFPRIPRSAINCTANNSNRVRYEADGDLYEYNTFIGTYRVKKSNRRAFGPWTALE